MSMLLVVRNSGGYVIAFGPNDGTYQPNIPADCTQAVEEDPVLNFAPPTIKQQTDAICAAKGVTREVVWAVILATEGAARATALAMELPEAAVLAEAYARMKLYRECKDTEAACRVVELAS